VLRPGNIVTDTKKGNLRQNIELSRAELAQKVANLQLQLAEKEDVTEKLKITVSELKAEHAKSKAEYESTVTRHQKFIDKVYISLLCDNLICFFDKIVCLNALIFNDTNNKNSN